MVFLSFDIRVGMYRLLNKQPNDEYHLCFQFFDTKKSNFCLEKFLAYFISNLANNLVRDLEKRKNTKVLETHFFFPTNASGLILQGLTVVLYF